VVASLDGGRLSSAIVVASAVAADIVIVNALFCALFRMNNSILNASLIAARKPQLIFMRAPHAQH